MVLIGLWYVCCGYEMQHVKERGNDLCAAGAFFLLPVGLVFMGILWWSFLRSDGAHGGWVYAATCVGASPLMLVLLMLAYGF